LLYFINYLKTNLHKKRDELLSELLGFTKRNFLLKYRNKSQLFPELALPLIVLLFITAGNYAFTQEFHKEGYFLPEQNHLIGNRIKVAFVKYYHTTEQMKQEYIRDNEGQNYNSQSFGIKFVDHNFPLEYTIFKAWSIELFFKNSVKLFELSYAFNKESTDILNKYTECAGNRMSALKNYTDLAVKSENYYSISFKK